MKYRILKRTTNSLGESKTRYLIQNKFLFWWINSSLTTGYTLRIKNGSSSDMMLRKCIVTFDSHEEASAYIDKVANPFVEYYNGNKIIEVLSENTWETVFVNTSNLTERYAESPCYEYSSSIEYLKKEIDKRAKKFN